MDDIHEGLVDQRHVEEKKIIIFSLGHRCTSSSLIKEMNQKFESLPFDWIVSKLDAIAHCIEDDFVEFLKVSNYEAKETETFNLCDGTKKTIMQENVVYNKYYEENAIFPNEIGTYGMQLCMTHHDLRKEVDLQYFERCVGRFRNMMLSEQRKFYLYAHPIMGFHDYAATFESLTKYFTFFTDYFKTKTQNSFGIYFIIVQDEERRGTVEKLFENEDCVIFTLFANNKLVDGGGVFCGEDWYTEQYQILKTIESRCN